jgi:hypothetical protein
VTDARLYENHGTDDTEWHCRCHRSESQYGNVRHGEIQKFISPQGAICHETPQGSPFRDYHVVISTFGSALVDIFPVSVLSKYPGLYSGLEVQRTSSKGKTTMSAYRKTFLRFAALSVLILGTIAMKPTRADALTCINNCNVQRFSCVQRGCGGFNGDPLCIDACTGQYNDCLAAC